MYEGPVSYSLFTKPTILLGLDWFVLTLRKDALQSVSAMLGCRPSLSHTFTYKKISFLEIAGKDGNK